MLRFGPNGMNQSFGNRYYSLDEETFNNIKSRLRKTEIYNLDYKEIIEKYPDACYFMDPPYFSQKSSYAGFSKEQFKRTQKLAINSLYSTVFWILFYEIDLIFIGRVDGASAAALYSAAWTLISFLRAIYSSLFSPFTARFNHFKGLNDEEGLKNAFKESIHLTLPIIFFSIIPLFLYMNSFIYSYIGYGYEGTIILGQFLVLCFIYNPVTNPASLILITHERVKESYLISTLMALVFWIGIFISYKYLGTLSLALFKFIGFTISAVILLNISLKYLSMKYMDFIKSYVFPLVVPLLTLIIISLFITPILPTDKNWFNLAINLVVIGINSLIGIIEYYIFSPDFRTLAKKFITDLLKSPKKK